MRSVVLTTLAVVSVSACGNATPTRTATPRPTATVEPRPSAAVGPCASVMATTPISQVPAACAALWAPYGVTKVPPANLTDSTPVPPAVINETQGAVSDGDARAWALAANRGSSWYRWAEENTQSILLPHLGVVQLDPPAELQALAAGDTILQPDCAIFPEKVSLYAIDATASKFFASLGETPASRYALVATFPGPCTVTANGPNGQSRTLASYPTSGVTFFAGRLRTDAALGDLWFVDGAGNCSDRGAPSRWCA